MTTSELTNLDPNNQNAIDGDLSFQAINKKLLNLKVIEFLLLAIIFTFGILVTVFSNDRNFIITGITLITTSFFLLLINRQVFQNVKNSINRFEANEKAELYSYLLSDNSLDKNTFTPIRRKALQYSQKLIDDYKRTRNLSRNLYYILQIATIILSGVTPILVLVDKLEAGQAWLKWLPVICPAIASIVASIVTSFPFQKNSVAANTCVELLEAEQEKFVLGITPYYRCYDSTDEVEQQQKAKQAIENFITQVNNIHLNQLQEIGEGQKREEKEQQQAENSQPTAEQS
ncbi:hypothetical protein BZZ01_07055 [Nostocales cyanobacterium HT-58-2]|nr:hypothetical protein BZZ01_07055 [Nostocales cyanobacterium HT-58-2]